MTYEVIILIAESLVAYLLVLGAHAIRHHVGLAHFYALIGGLTAVMSWVTDAGVVVDVAGISFMVGSTVFYTSLLLAVFVVYVFDGVRATRVAISTVMGGVHHGAPDRHGAEPANGAGRHARPGLCAFSQPAHQHRLGGGHLHGPVVPGHRLGVHEQPHAVHPPGHPGLFHPAGGHVAGRNPVRHRGLCRPSRVLVHCAGHRPEPADRLLLCRRPSCGLTWPGKTASGTPR